jgi:hypothetical protein
MRRISRSRSTIALVGIAAIALGLSIVASLVPDSSYLRYQLLNYTDIIDARGIYERIHFDDRPIDVFVVGASNALLGISATRMEENLSHRGLSVRIENFGALFGGRNLNYVLVKEMYKAGRRPKLLVISVAARPAHFGHPTFKYFADASDIVDPIYLVNLDYFSDLQYLPFRQMKLAAMRWFPHAFKASIKFDRIMYAHREIDLAGSVKIARHGMLLDRDRKLSATDLKEAKNFGFFGKPILPVALADIEFGDEKYYIPKIVALARAHNTKVVFVYIPNFQGPPKPLFEDFYIHYGPVIDANYLKDNDQMFFDAVHMNRSGALAVTYWLTNPIAQMLGD